MFSTRTSLTCHGFLRAVLVTTATVGVACHGDEAVRPSGVWLATQANAITSPATPLVLALNARPLHAARYRADSAAFPILLATVRLRGLVGDSVTLTLQGDQGVLNAAGVDAEVIMTSDTGNMVLSFQQLAATVTVYRFQSASTVTLRYRLARKVAVPRDGQFWLAQNTTAHIEQSELPWVPRNAIGGAAVVSVATHASASAMNGPTLTCAFLRQAVTPCDDMNAMIAPFSPGNPFGTFQSNPGSGPSAPISITFSRPILSITITIQDPTWAGNTMTAYDLAGGTIGSLSFAFNNTPGTNAPDTQTISGAISRVEVRPAPSDYVAYDGSFTVTGQDVIVNCTPSSLVRGAAVDCETKLLVPQPFTVERRSATGTGFTVQDTTTFSYPAGGADHWIGTAVATSDVTVRVVITDVSGTRKLVNATPARFQLGNRRWADWRFTQRDSLITTRPHALQMTAYPTPNRGSFGLFGPTPPDTAYPMRAVVAGPNATLWYLRDSVQVRGYFIFIHPALTPTPPGWKPSSPGYQPWHAWYDDQNGKSTIVMNSCRASEVATFRTNVERHEGVTGATNSHLGEANMAFPTHRPQDAIEIMYAVNRTDLQYNVWNSIHTYFNSPTSLYRVVQRTFDSNDTPNVYAIGCNLDFVPLPDP